VSDKLVDKSARKLVSVSVSMSVLWNYSILTTFVGRLLIVLIVVDVPWRNMSQSRVWSKVPAKVPLLFVHKLTRISMFL